MTTTVDRSRSLMPLPGGPTGVSPISKGVRNSVSARTEKRNCPRRIVPAVPVTFAVRMALAMSSLVMLSPRIRAGSTSMRISSVGVPTTATLATPPICSSRRA